MDRNMLARATEGTEAPTPGYLYVDLAKAATANPLACQEMGQYLTRRLANKSNPNIKYKCCKIIAKLADNVPRNQFRRVISQDPQGVQAIKDTMNYRGPFDPVRGDEPNQKVRIAAKEALDAIYRDAPTAETTSSPSPGASGAGAGYSSSYGPSPHHPSSNNYGPSSYGGNSSRGGGGGGGGGGRMEGIGNPMFPDPRLDPRYNNGNNPPSNIRDAMREAGEVVLGMIKDPLARNIEYGTSTNPHHPNQQHHHSGSLPGYGSNSHSSYGGRPPPGAMELSQRTGGEWTMASNRGPSAIQPPPNYNNDSAYYKSRDQYSNNNNSSYQYAEKPSSTTTPSVSLGTVGGSWGNAMVNSNQQNQHSSTPSVMITSAPPGTYGSNGRAGGGGGGGSTGHAASDGSYEKNIIMELCPPGGLKATPPPDKLATFAKNVSTLNADLICPALLDCLEDGQPWIIRAKALCVMETCIELGMKPTEGLNPYLNFFYACQEEIVPLASHPRAAIKEPAIRVLALLGIPVPNANVASSTSSSSTTTTPSSSSLPPSQMMSTAPPPNLLDFEDDGDDNNHSEPNSGVVGTTAPRPPPNQPPPPPPGGSNPTSALFGGMQVKSGGGGGLIKNTQPPASTPSTDVGNLLGDWETTDGAMSNTATPSVFRGTTNVNQPSTSATSDMFGALSIKDQQQQDSSIAEDKKTDSEDAGDYGHHNGSGGLGGGAIGSAFGFINESTSTEASNSNHVTKPAQSFDPLAAGAGALTMTPSGPSTTNKMLAMSPDQMQAMMYQQMMMQQKMQQMQWAMAMGGGSGAVGGVGVPGHHLPMMMSGPGVPPPMMMSQSSGSMGMVPPPPSMMMSQSSGSVGMGGTLGGGGGRPTGGISTFGATKPATKDDKKFDFVMDAMKNAK